MTNLRKLIVTMTYAYVCGSDVRAYPRDEGGGGGHGGSDAGDVHSDGFIPDFHECNDSCLVE